MENLSDQRKEDANEIENTLLECYRELSKNEKLLVELKKYISHLELQNQYLTSENDEFRRKYRMITDTWFGKCALKFYHILVKLKKH